MSFLNQLKAQASAAQEQQGARLESLAANAVATELAGKTVWLYLGDLAKQLNVIGPAGPRLTLDNKTPWPAMKLSGFRVDTRRKTLRNKEVLDYIAMAWSILPAGSPPVAGSVSANFPPDLQRIESRLQSGAVPHERVNVRHPEKNTLQAIRFDYSTEARGNVTVTADHDNAQLSFRLTNLQGLEIVTKVYPVQDIQTGLLDELAKMVVGQPSSFVWPDAPIR